MTRTLDPDFYIVGLMVIRVLAFFMISMVNLMSEYSTHGVVEPAQRRGILYRLMEHSTKFMLVLSLLPVWLAISVCIYSITHSIAREYYRDNNIYDGHLVVRVYIQVVFTICIIITTWY